MAQYKFCHLINPVSEKESKELYNVQPFTFESIVRAKKIAANQGLSVQLLACFVKNNTCSLPEGSFTPVSPLERVSSDIIPTQKQVPYFNDLLQRLYDFSDAEYLIYTNLDICLMPGFYSAVNALIEKGHDAIIINRRVIGIDHLEHGNMELMYADLGEVHTGYDTFIFKKELFTKFILKDICVGVPPVGNDLFHNIFVFAKNPTLETKLHLTFHIGQELVKRWGDGPIWKQNHTEYKKLLKQIGPLIKIENFPGANKSFFSRHFKWMWNPTISYPLMLKTDLKNLGKKRKAKKKREIPGLRQRYYEWLIKKLDLD